MTSLMGRDINAYFDKSGSQRFRHAVMAEFESLKEDERLLENMIDRLAKELGEIAFCSDAEAVKTTKTLWKFFDFGSKVGVAGDITTEGAAKSVGRFLQYTYRRLKAARREAAQAKLEAASASRIGEELKTFIRGVATGEITLKRCPACDGKGEYERECWEEEEAVLVPCCRCRGIGWRDENDIKPWELVEAQDEEDKT